MMSTLEHLRRGFEKNSQIRLGKTLDVQSHDNALLFRELPYRGHEAPRRSFEKTRAIDQLPGAVLANMGKILHIVDSVGGDGVTFRTLKLHCQDV